MSILSKVHITVGDGESNVVSSNIENSNAHINCSYSTDGINYDVKVDDYFRD